MKPGLSEFQLHIWPQIPFKELEPSSGYKPVCYVVHQQPDASEEIFKDFLF